MPKRSDFEWLEDRSDWIKNAYRLKLEVEYRRTHGTSFQLLFDRIMRSIHGEDYIATATYGNEGDLGCDGFLKSRKVFFAVYSPSPYFKLAEARDKMKADFARFEECWQIPKQAKHWTFVINYPGAHPSLLALAQEFEERHPELTVTIWSRYDLTQQFLIFARIDLLLPEFGSVEQKVQELAPLHFVPEDTALPSKEATLTYRRLSARITCQKADYDELTNEWLDQLSQEPLRWMMVHFQFLVGAMASVGMAGSFAIEDPPLRRLKFETGVADFAWRKYFKTAWGGPASLIFKEDYKKEVPPIGGDIDMLIGVCLVQDALTLATIRVHSRITGLWENEILEEVWSYVTEIKIHPE
jgi:hypothetical protein